MKNICIVMSSLGDGGAQKMVKYITNFLSNQNNNKVILLLFEKNIDDRKKINSNVEIIYLKRKLDLIGIVDLIIQLKKNNPNIIFLSLGPLNAIFSIFLFFFKKVKVIARETNIPSIINKIKYKEKKIYILIDYLYKLSYKYYDLIIAQSDDMKNDLVKNYGILPSKIIKINNLIDLELMQNSLNENDKKVEELFSQKKIYGISVGRLTKQKGYHLLISKVNEIKKMDIKIYILGRGEEEKNLKDQIRELKLEDKIEILPYDNNPYKYLKKSDFFILPSIVEGFSNSLIEALGVGLPAIVNNCKGGINEIIIPEINGEVIDFNAEGKLEESILKVLSFNPVRIRVDALKKYDKNLILEQYRSIFERISEE